MTINIQKIPRIIKIISRSFRQYRWKFSLIILIGFLAGLSGAFGISTLIPIFSLLTGQETAGLGFVTNIIHGAFNFLHIPFTLPYVLVLTAILFILKGFIQFIGKYYTEKIYTDYGNSIRIGLFRKTLRASWPYLINQKLGYLERVVMGDTSMMATVIGQISSLILTSTSFIIYAIFAFKISPSVTIITTVFGIILFVVFRPILYKIRKASQNVRDSQKQIAHFVNENIVGAKMIKTSGTETEVIARGNVYFQKFRDNSLAMALLNHAVGAVFEPIGFVFIAVLILFYYRSPSFEIASFTVIIYLIQKIFTFIQQGQSTIQSIISSAPYIQSVNHYRKEVTLNKEILEGDAFTFQNMIEFKNVEFSYDTDRGILSDISFSIRKGEIVGLIGPSGSGKTTIADLLMRLFPLGRGEITVDGKNIAGIDLNNWRRSIGYMPQDTFLLNDTIENNIRFYNKSLSQDEIVKAAQMANIYDFIQELPEGFNTIIGERGIKVSAGQRQRIALARTLVNNPEIIIFDEATSALDNQSELMIQKTIENLRGKITMLVIAHRLSTIMNSDKLIMIEKGKIIEEGSPDKLLADKDSHFYKINNIIN